ncbi:MAG: hypothetical protein V1837_08185 [Candidatus Woesearchaeota archaeon]
MKKRAYVCLVVLALSILAINLTYAAKTCVSCDTANNRVQQDYYADCASGKSCDWCSKNKVATTTYTQCSSGTQVCRNDACCTLNCIDSQNQYKCDSASDGCGGTRCSCPSGYACKNSENRCYAITCTYGTDCNDNNGCTTDTCTNGGAWNSACSHPNACTGSQICCSNTCTTPACSSSTNCNDNNGCTDNICNLGSSCSAYCSNPNICTASQICYNNACCTPDSNCPSQYCTTQTCDDKCGHTLPGAKDCTCTGDCTNKACGADNGCNSPCLTGSCSQTGYTCVSGVCQPPSCTPSNACAANTCPDTTCQDTCGTTYQGTKSACISGDGCCPTGCTSSDTDCSPCQPACGANSVCVDGTCKKKNTKGCSSNSDCCSDNCCGSTCFGSTVFCGGNNLKADTVSCDTSYACRCASGNCCYNPDSGSAYCVGPANCIHAGQAASSDCLCCSGVTDYSGKCLLCATYKSCADKGFNCGTTDDGCGGTLDCGPVPLPTDTEKQCTSNVLHEKACHDYKDNDDDGLTDCQDSDCAGVCQCSDTDADFTNNGRNYAVGGTVKANLGSGTDSCKEKTLTEYYCGTGTSTGMGVHEEVTCDQACYTKDRKGECCAFKFNCNKQNYQCGCLHDDGCGGTYCCGKSDNSGNCTTSGQRCTGAPFYQCTSGNIADGQPCTADKDCLSGFCRGTPKVCVPCIDDDGCTYVDKIRCSGKTGERTNEYYTCKISGPGNCMHWTNTTTTCGGQSCFCDITTNQCQTCSGDKICLNYKCGIYEKRYFAWYSPPTDTFHLQTACSKDFFIVSNENTYYTSSVPLECCKGRLGPLQVKFCSYGETCSGAIDAFPCGIDCGTDGVCGLDENCENCPQDCPCLCPIDQCKNAAGACVAGTDNSACGSGGGQCTDCATGEFCNAGTHRCEGCTQQCTGKCGGADSLCPTNPYCGTPGATGQDICLDGQVCSGQTCVPAQCSTFQDSGTCNAQAARCDWCPTCYGGKSNGQSADQCVSEGACLASNYNICSRSCGATCDSTGGCTLPNVCDPNTCTCRLPPADCNNGWVEPPDENCEYPDTINNNNCYQSISQCVNTKIQYRPDNYGDCGATCQCVLDAFVGSAQCLRGSGCGAVCDATGGCVAPNVCNIDTCDCYNPISCSDTDPSNDIYTPGSCSDGVGAHPDSCSSNTLTQYSCSGGSCIASTQDCPAGTNCVVDKCVLIVSCDTDGTCDPGETCSCTDCNGRQDGCPSGQVCANGVCTSTATCLSYQNLGQCAADLNCEWCLMCKDTKYNGLTADQCVPKNACPAHNTCMRMCGSSCDATGACSGGSVCDPASCTCMAPDDRATFVSQSVQNSMPKNSQQAVTVTMQNSGTTTWNYNYRLGSQNPQDNLMWGIGRIFLGTTETIAPGQSKTFSFSITSPGAATVQNFQWKMVNEMVRWFGDYSTNVPITITDCDCNIGQCCDGCHYRTTSYVCDNAYATEYGCPFGTTCGTNVATRYKNRSCSGTSAQCSGAISNWGNWQVVQTCSSNQRCVAGNPNCVTDSVCADQCASGICCNMTKHPYKFMPTDFVCQTTDSCNPAKTSVCDYKTCDSLGSCSTYKGCSSCSLKPIIADCGVPTGQCISQAGGDVCGYTNDNSKCATCSEECDQSTFMCIGQEQKGQCEYTYEQCIALANNPQPGKEPSDPAQCICHQYWTACT